MMKLMVVATLAASALANPRLASNDGNVALSIGAGNSFSVVCPNSTGAVQCSGPNVQVVDGQCVPTTQYATAGDLTDVTDDVSDLTRAITVTNTSTARQIAGLQAALEALQNQLSSAPDCVVGVEYNNGSGCVPVSSPCDGGLYERSPPSRSTDRICRPYSKCSGSQYESSPPGAFRDRLCMPLTECNSTAWERHAPTMYSDRVCENARSACPIDGYSGFVKINTGTHVRTSYCHNDGTDVGGDGSDLNEAGLSCNTIRRAFNVQTSGARWIMGSDRGTPFRAYCDMTSCGGDDSGYWTSANKSLCGGWTMVMKAAQASDCLNRRQTGRWKSVSTFGETITTNNACGKGLAYSRNAFTDIMIASLRSTRSGNNFAWRHPDTRTSMYDVVSSCDRWRNGQIIVPDYHAPTRDHIVNSLFHMDWRSGVGQNLGGHNQFSNHKTCYGGGNEKLYWGFFNRDSDCCGGSIIGCRSNWGHAGNVVGFGMECGDAGSWNCGHGTSARNVECITAFGFGGGYGGTSGGAERETCTGHWWGHGNQHMQVYATGLYVRDAKEWPGQHIM